MDTRLLSPDLFCVRITKCKKTREGQKIVTARNGKIYIERNEGDIARVRGWYRNGQLISWRRHWRIRQRAVNSGDHVVIICSIAYCLVNKYKHFTIYGRL